MSLVSFSPDILASPFISLDQGIISLVYSSDFIERSQKFSFFLVPKWSTLSPLSVLWSVYANLLYHTDIERIVYIRTDDVSEITGAADDGIDFVLGKTLYYDKDYYHSTGIIDNYKHDFYINDVFWSTQVLYVRFLENIKLVPIVLPRSNYWSWVRKQLKDILQDIQQDAHTICIMINHSTFSINQDSHVEFIHNDTMSEYDMLFYDYCIDNSIQPHLLQSEWLDWDIYHWVFAV
jgi:hypothetical protein